MNWHTKRNFGTRNSLSNISTVQEKTEFDQFVQNRDKCLNLIRIRHEKELRPLFSRKSNRHEYLLVDPADHNNFGDTMIADSERLLLGILNGNNSFNECGYSQSSLKKKKSTHCNTVISSMGRSNKKMLLSGMEAEIGVIYGKLRIITELNHLDYFSQIIFL